MANVSVDREGRLFLDAQPVAEGALRAQLQTRWGANHELRAVISADRAVPHGRVTEVIDLVRQAGVTRFAIQTQQPAQP